MYVLSPSRILKDWSISLPGTCGYKDIHGFMNSWIHEFMNYQGTWKSGDAIWKHAFMPLYCNCQGKWKPGEPIWSVLHLSRYMEISWRHIKVYFHTFVLQLSRYIKINSFPISPPDSTVKFENFQNIVLYVCFGMSRVCTLQYMF